MHTSEHAVHTSEHAVQTLEHDVDTIEHAGGNSQYAVAIAVDTSEHLWNLKTCHPHFETCRAHLRNAVYTSEHAVPTSKHTVHMLKPSVDTSEYTSEHQWMPHKMPCKPGLCEKRLKVAPNQTSQKVTFRD